MGQRSQIYVRFTDADGHKYLTARYFGWCFGTRMVSRCRYTLEWIMDNIKSPWKLAYDNQNLIRIIETNFDFKNNIETGDIIDEYLRYCKNDSFNEAVFLRQDNNDGKLLIDICGETVKYAFLDRDSSADNIMDAEAYMQWDEGEGPENWRNKRFMEKHVAYTENNIAKINEIATVMSKEEVVDFLECEYQIDLLKSKETKNREFWEKAVRELVLEINNSKQFDTCDIDNESFVAYICKKTGIQEYQYKDIMGIEE